MTSTKCDLVCFLCLNTIDANHTKLPLSADEGLIVNYLLKRFIHFCKTFLNVENAENRLKVGCNDIDKIVHPLKFPVFCDECEFRVIEMLEIHVEVKALECKLLWRVMSLGEKVKQSSKPLRDQQFPIQTLTSLASQLESDTHYLLVELFRTSLAEKCQVKGEEILPKIAVTRCNFNKDVRRKHGSLSSRIKNADTHSVTAIMAVYFLAEDFLLLKVKCNQELSQAFVAVGSSTKRIPSRKTLSIFCTLVVLCAIGLDWNLGKILRAYSSKEELTVRSVDSNKEKSRKRQKLKIRVKSELPEMETRDESPEPANMEYSPANSPCPLDQASPCNEYHELDVKVEFGACDTGCQSIKEQIVHGAGTSGEPVPKRRRLAKPFKRKLKVTVMSSERNLKTRNRKRNAVQLKKVESLNLEGSLEPMNEVKSEPLHQYTSEPDPQDSAESEHTHNSQKTASTGKQLRNSSSGFHIKCKLCEFTFVKMLSYEDHLRQLHPSVSPTQSLKCELCSEEFPSYSTLMLHLKNKHLQDETRYSCVYCPESFSNLQLYSLHRLNYHWIHPQQLLCDDDACEYSCSLPKDLHTHMESHLKPDVDPRTIYSCEVCSLPFFNQQRLKVHSLLHSESESKWGNRYRCSKCYFVSSSTYKMGVHFNEKHTETADRVELLLCPEEQECEFYFFNEKTRNAHKTVHENYAKTTLTNNLGRGRVQSCLFCHQEFIRFSDRLKHEGCCPSGPSPELQAKGSSKYVCPVCANGFHQRNHLKRHLLSHYPPAWECHLCDGKFKREDNLQQHVLKMHTKSTQMVCHICGRVCTSSGEMKYHMKEHEKTHLCTLCGKNFSRGFLLKCHMRQHTGEKLQCEWCEVTYSTVAAVRMHMERNHAEKWKEKYGNWYRRQKIGYRLVISGENIRDTTGSGNESKEKMRQVKGTKKRKHSRRRTATNDDESS